MAQIKLAEYTFDNSVGDCLPTLTPNTITMTTEDTVNDTTTRRIIYIDDATMPTNIKFAQYNSLLTVDYINMGSHITSCGQMFYRSTSLKSINTSNWDLPNVTSYERFIMSCSKLESIDFSFVTRTKTVNFYRAFEGLNVLHTMTGMQGLTIDQFMINSVKLKTLDLTGTTMIHTSFNKMFNNCQGLTEIKGIENWDVSSVTDFSFMFQKCSSLTKLDLRNWVTSSATTMQGMFHSCSSLTEIKGIENFNVSSVTTFGSMFYLCKSLTKLDLRSWVTSSATTFQDMFASCHNLEVIRVDNFDTSKVTGTGFNQMFSYCKKVKTLNLNSFTRSGSLGNFNSFCSNCSSLEYISMQNFAFGNCTSMDGTFTNCTSLKMLDLTALDSSTFSSKTYGISGVIENITCPVYYNSNTCSSSDFTDIPNKTNLIDVQGRLMAVYDFNNTVTTSDSAYPTLTGSTVVKTIDTQGSESYITHRVISVDVMPTEIKFGGIVTGLLNVDYLAVTSSCTKLTNLFADCIRLSSVNIFGWDTQNVTDLSSMFDDCSQLIEIDLSQCNFKNVEGLYGTFYYCSALETLHLPTTFTTSLISLGRTFWSCSKLSTITGLSEIDTSKVSNFDRTFEGVTSLMEIDLSKWNTSSATGSSGMFGGWTSDQIVYVHDTNWTIDVSSYNATFVRRLSTLLAKYTFDNSIGDCLPTITGITTSDYKVSDIVNDIVTTRLITMNEGDYDITMIFQALTNLLTIEEINLSQLIEFSAPRCTSLGYTNFSNQSTSKLRRLYFEFGSTNLDIRNMQATDLRDLSFTFKNCGVTFITDENTRWSGVTSTANMFLASGLKGDQNLNFIDVSKCTTMYRTFGECYSLVSVDISEWDTSSNTTLENFFGHCTSLTNINGLDFLCTSKVTNIANMFVNCKKLTSVDVSSWDTSQVTKATALFENCNALQEINGIEDLDTSSMTAVNGMFSNCLLLTSLDLRKWKTSNVEDFGNMFDTCSSLASLQLNFDTSNAKYMGWMFRKATALTELDLSMFDTRKVTVTNQTFDGWTSAQTVYYEPPFWSIGTTTLNSNINWVINVTRNNGYWLDMSAITGATEITLSNENNLPTEEILTDWGDGTQDSELTHTYSTAGEYVVVSNLQNAKSSGNLKDYVTKMVVYYASTPASLCFNYNKITEVTLTNNWAEKTIEKYGQKVSMTQMFRNCPLLELPNLEPIKQFKPTYCVGMFYNCQKFTSIDLTGWDLSNCTAMDLMFSGCSNLTEIKGIENLNVSKCTSFNSLFATCPSLTSLDLSSWNTSSCTNMSSMFYDCSSLTSLDLSSWDISKVTTINKMFWKCTSLTDCSFIESWDFSSMDNMLDAFAYSSIKSFNFRNKTLNKLQYCATMLAYNTSLESVDFSGTTMTYNGGGIGNPTGIFDGCTNLKTAKFDNMTFIPKNCSNMFRNCSSLTSLDLSSWDTSQCSAMTYGFSNCKKLKELDLSSFVFNSDCNCNYLLHTMPSLEVLDFSNYSTPKVGNYLLSNTKIKTIGMLYSSAESINEFTSKLLAGDTSTSDPYDMTNGLTIYYYDADPTELTPVEGVTFKKYQTPTTIQLPPHIQLHSLPDGTRDEVDIKTGILTRNVGYTKHAPKDLFGITTGFGRGVSYDATTERWIGHQPSIDYTIFNSIGISNFQRKSVATAPISIYKVNSDWIGIAIKLAELTSKGYANTQEGFLDYVLNEEIMAMYPLTTPTTEQLILNYNNSCDYGRILPTGMCDKYDVVNSMYTQTMTSILLDGANTWDAMEEFENTVKFTATGTTVGVEELNMLGAGGLYCDNDLFPNINDDSDVEHCRVDEAGNKFYIYISKDRLMSPDLIGYQIWLQENNFNLIYELAEHLIYVKPYGELDATQARWEGMDCMREGVIKYHTNSSDNITMYPTLEYIAPSINNFEVPMLEPNTNYTIYAEGINANDTINLGGNDINFNNGTVYTSGDNQWLRIDNNDSFYNMVITKGDTTGEVVPYFEGMASVENPMVYCGSSKNLFDGKFVFGSMGGGGLEDTENRLRSENYIPIQPNTKYTITCYSGYNVRYVAYYDENKNFISGTDFNLYSVMKVTTPSDNSVKYMLFNCAKNDTSENFTLDDLRNTKAQVELGDVSTEYAPLLSEVSYTDLKLRSLPNGVKDTINVVTGEYVQRIGEIVFDGSEDWTRSAHTNSTMFYTPLNDLVHKEDYLNIVNCDKLVMHTDSESLYDSTLPNGISAYVDWTDTYPNENWICIKYADSEGYVEKFKQWLSQNPITVQYELAEPITTKLDSQTLLAYTDGTINLSSDTGLLPTTHYTVPSTNTFHLPSMKTGTRYTLKYPSASGSITIGDINYSISSDSMLFTTPLKINGDTSAIIFSDGNPENVILLEGAYNKREVPFFTGVKSVKNPNITIIDQLSTESTTYNCETEIELRGLPNGVADKLDIVKGKLTTNVGIRPYQEGDEELDNIWTDGYETVYALSSPVVTNVIIDQPTVTTNSLIELSSDYLIPQLNYRAPSSNNFPLDLLQPNSTYTLYADALTSGSFTLGGTYNGVFTGTQTITLGDITDNLLTFNGDLGLSNVMLVKGNSLKTTLPPYFLGIRSVTDGHLLVEGMAGEMNEITFDEDIVLRDCNGVKDVIDLTTGILTKRTGEVILTGKEGWRLNTSSSLVINDEFVAFNLTLTGIKSSEVNGLVCDNFTHSYLYNKAYDREAIYSIGGELRLCVKKSRIGGDTVNALKSWLNQNNTTVVYSLSTPLEVQLENTWTIVPPTSYNNQTEISSTVSSNSLKPMISVTVATTTLEEIVSNLEAQNAQLEDENVATMLALTSVYETLATPMAVATMSLDDEVSTVNLSDGNNVNGMSVSPIGMVYVNLIRKGLKTIEQVPYNLQPEVMYALRGTE